MKEKKEDSSSSVSLAKIVTILGIISALSGLIYGYVSWHFNTFVYQDKMTQYQTEMKSQLDSMQKELSNKNALNYLEVIIILKENELRELDQKLDSGATLSAEEQRRQQSIIDSISSFKQQRNVLIGLPEGLQ